jgi:hypothetical protein
MIINIINERLDQAEEIEGNEEDDEKRRRTGVWVRDCHAEVLARRLMPLIVENETTVEQQHLEKTGKNHWIRSIWDSRMRDDYDHGYVVVAKSKSMLDPDPV